VDGLLRQDFTNHSPSNIGQPDVATAESIGERRVIDAQQVQNRGVQVVPD
jgi:hypothetical protein